MDIDDFKIDVYVPSLQKMVRFGQLSNKIYKNILKYTHAKNDVNLHEYFMNIINTLSPSIRTDDINKIDLFCILLTLRIVCVGPTIELQFKCRSTGKSYNTTVDLNDTLQKFTDIGEAIQATVELGDDISIRLGIPDSLYTDDVDMIDTMTYCVTDINIKDNTYNLSTLAPRERKHIINKLPGRVFNYIVRYANNIQSKFNELVVLSEKSPHHENSELEEHKLGLYNNSMFNFVRLIYADNLVGYYEMLYALSSNINMSATYVESITPAEAAIFLATRRKELAQQEQSQKAQESRNRGPSLPNRMSGLVDNL